MRAYAPIRCAQFPQNAILTLTVVMQLHSAMAFAGGWLAACHTSAYTPAADYMNAAAFSRI
jgi:hypothetical protein